MMTSRSRALGVLGVASALLLAGCGSAGNGARPATPAPVATAAPLSSVPSFTSPAATPTPAPLPDAERWHPVGHLAPAAGRLDAPSGLVYENGTYHVFYRHNPTGVERDGVAGWAHATSTDLLTWVEQPLVLPGNADEQVLSGTVVLDRNNTSGLGTTDQPPLVAYSASISSGSLADSLLYSTDHGVTWQESEDSPVLSPSSSARDLRDAKITWYEPGGYWLMVGAAADEFAVQLYRSDDLADWELLGDFTGYGVQAGAWSHPDLFPLALDGNPDDTRWVLLVSVEAGGIAGGSGVQYFVGSFDGTTFTPDPLGPAGVGAIQPGEMHSWMDWGPDLFGATTVGGAPDGRVVTLGLLGDQAYADAVPTPDWRGSLSWPRDLTLVTVDGVPRLRSTVPSEVSTAVGATAPVFADDEIGIANGSRKLDSDAAGTHLDITATLTPGTATVSGVTVLGSATGQRATRIQYVQETGILQIDRTTSGRTDFSAAFFPGAAAAVPLTDGSLDLHIVVDGSSVEVFAGGGAAVLSALVFPTAEDDNVGVFAGGGKATVSSLVVTPLGG